MHKPSHLQNFSNKGLYRTLVLVCLAVVTLVIVSTYLVFERESAEKKVRFMAESRWSLEIVKGFLNSELKSVEQDLIFLTRNPEFSEYLQSENALPDAAVTERTLAQFGAIRNKYSKIRIIDENGRERLKVDYRPGGYDVNQNLQDKTERYYFKAAKPLGPGGIYISRFDLNMENGKVSQPPQPVIRFLSPIHSADGIKLGYVVLTYNGSLILDRINLVEQNSNLKLFLADAQGNWLKGPESQESFAFMLNPDSEDQLSRHFPALEPLLETDNRGNVESDSGILAFENLNAEQMMSNESSAVFQASGWTLLAQLDNERLGASLSSIRRDLSLSALVMLAMILPTIFLLFGNLIRKNDQLNAFMFELEYSNAELKNSQTRLQHNLADLEELTQEKEEFIEELEHKEKELVAAKENAEQGARAKSDFLATMSHEIRTPLNAVLGMADLLDRTTLNAEQRDLLRTIRSSGDSLLSVIDDILDFSKIQSGKMEFEHKPFMLEDTLFEALDQVYQRARQKGLSVMYRVEGDLALDVFGDPTRLRQILLNLVSNAVKFTDSGRILLSVQANRSKTELPGNYLFSVEDTGIGIPMDKAPFLFQAFSQIDSSVNRKHGGSGLGLAISRRLVQQMGGEMHFQSEPGAGSIFYFSINLNRQIGIDSDQRLEILRGRTVRLHVCNQKQREILEDACRIRGFRLVGASDAGPVDFELFEPRALGAHQPSGQYQVALLHPSDELQTESEGWLRFPMPVHIGRLWYFLATCLDARLANPAAAETTPERVVPEHIDRSEINVLLVEDNPINLRLAQLILEKLGFQPDHALNGFEALDAVRKKRYDIVLMDIQMPGMDGIQATKAIRREFGQAHVIIAMTANAMEGDRERYMSEGMDDYISKPFSYALLQERLEHWIAALAPKFKTTAR